MNDKSNASLQRGIMLFELHRYQEAEVQLRKALTAEPDNGAIYAFLSLCLMKQGHKGKAVDVAKTAVAKAPELHLSHFALASAYVGSHKFKDAERSLQEAQRLDPEFTGGFLISAAIAIARKEWSKALAATDSGLAIEPEHVALLEVRAGALSSLGRSSEATQCIDRALQLDPESSSVHCAKGWDLIQHNQIEDAIEHFRTALRLDPDSQYAYTGVVEALKSRNPIYSLALRSIMFIGNNWPAAIVMLVVVLFMRTSENEMLQHVLVIAGIAMLVCPALFTLLLRLDPLGNRVLTDKAKRDNNNKLIRLGLIATVVCALLFYPREPSADQETLNAAQTFYRTGQKDEALRLWKKQYDAAVEFDKKTESWSAEKEDVTDDFANIAKSIGGAKEAQHLRCKSLLKEGSLWVVRYKPEKAVSRFEDAERLAKDAGDSQLEGIAILGRARAAAVERGWTVFSWWDQAGCLDCCERAVRVLQSTANWSDSPARTTLNECIATLKSEHSDKDQDRAIRTKLSSAFDELLSSATDP